MAQFETVYKASRTPRKGPYAGERITEWHRYSTKSLTDAHRRIHAKHPEAETYFGAKRIITCFIDSPRFQLDAPIVSGGFRVNMAA